LLRKLGTDSNTGAPYPTHQITANDIASRLQQVSKRQKRSEITDPDISANFSTEKLNTALLAVKSGIAVDWFTQNLFKILYKGPKHGSSPFFDAG
jgi:hypothetical protein